MGKRGRPKGYKRGPAKVWTTGEFLENVETGSGCWGWKGRKGTGGYGVLHDRGKLIMAHRWMWEAIEGEIPPGMLVCHGCDNPPCVRPSHLFLGTSRDNTLDSARKGRMQGKLSLSDVEEIKRLYVPGSKGENRGVRELAERFGVLRKHIWRIGTGRRCGGHDDRRKIARAKDRGEAAPGGSCDGSGGVCGDSLPLGGRKASDQQSCGGGISAVGE